MAETEMVQAAADERRPSEVIYLPTVPLEEPTVAPCCKICLESIPSEPHVSSCSNHHAFHRKCIVLYLETEIADGRVANIRCPDVGANGRCGCEFDPVFIENTVPPFIFGKYKKFVSFKRDPNVRDCPSCKSLTLGSPTIPDMECAACHQPFCYNHANAHPGIPCREFLRRRGETKSSQVRTRMWKGWNTKPCPHCKIPIEKNGGCPNMVCSTCGKSFCWCCMSSKQQHKSKIHHHKKHIAIGVAASPLIVAALPVLLFAVPGVILYKNLQRRPDRRLRRARVQVPARERPNPATCAHFFRAGSGSCIFCNILPPTPVTAESVDAHHLEQQRVPLKDSSSRPHATQTTPANATDAIRSKTLRNWS